MSNSGMPQIGQLDTLGVLYALLPGLIVFLVVRGLTARTRKIEAIEAVLHGLAYTLVVYALWDFLSQWSLIPTPERLGLCLCAIAVGVCIAWLTNTGKGYALLRRLGVTHQPPWKTVWQTSFERARSDYAGWIVLHFKDSRRVMGSLRGWSEERANGYVAIEGAKWLHGEEDKHDSSCPDLLLFDSDEIACVQFVSPQSGGSHA
jgi:hypothetical protein